MWMSYGEFLALMELKPSPDTFRFWLLSHTLTPILAQRVAQKRRDEISGDRT